MSDEKILHQADVEEVIEEVVAELAADADAGFVIKLSGGATIAVPASPGASYVQAEVVALRTAISALITALVDAEVIEAP